jgi:hypothetical protein
VNARNVAAEELHKLSLPDPELKTFVNDTTPAADARFNRLRARIAAAELHALAFPEEARTTEFWRSMVASGPIYRLKK